MNPRDTANKLFKLLGDDKPIPRIDPVQGWAKDFSPAFMAQVEADMNLFEEQDKAKAELAKIGWRPNKVTHG